MRISTPELFARGVDAMLDRQADLSRTELELATGKRILRPSDDPAATVRVFDLKEAQNKLAQFQRNADFADARLAQEESALEGMQNLLQRVRELAVRGNNGTMSQGDRQALAAEVRQHVDNYLQLANSQDANGEYIFAGFKSDTPPFSHDGVGGFTYAGDTGQRVVRIGETREVATGDAGDVFDGFAANAGGTTDIGAVLFTLADNYENGATDPDAITDLDTALGRVLNVRAAVGARMNAISEQRTANEAFEVAVSQVKSTLEDLDYAEAISRFNQQLTAFQAAQQTFVKVQDLTLFNLIR